jgi:signal transduction histidine kinase
VRRSWLTLGAVAVVSLLAAAGLAAGLAGSVSRPLRRLERVAADVGRGRFDVRAATDEGPSEVRALARAFNDTAERLAGLLASHDAFVADASHQLRSPLTALRLRLENIEAEVDGEVRDDVRAATAETERLSRIVDELLALARADREAGTPPTEAVDAVAVLEDRRAAWLSLADERGVTLAVERPNGMVLPLARATPDRLVQVLDNLLANAIEVAPAGSRIVLTATPSARPGWLEFHVLDHGPGLSEEERARAFDRFWRGRRAEPNGSGLSGSGLGLSIVRRLVIADGGEVELAARPEGGTDATVRLACATDA